MVKSKKKAAFLAVSGLSLLCSLPLLPLEVAKAQSGELKAESKAPSGLFETAAALLEKRAHQGNSDDQYRLASLYRIGRGVPQNDTLAFAWMVKAANNGHARAQYSLATLYLAGRGTPADVIQAEIWARKAAANGHQNAASLIAELTSRSSKQPGRNTPESTISVANSIDSEK